MSKASQILEAMYKISNIEKDIPEETKITYDSKQIRNIFMGTILEADEDFIQALRKCIDKMPDAWVIEFLETINGDSVNQI